MLRTKIIFLVLIVGILACQQTYLKKYPDQFPPEVVSRTSNLDLIITNYETAKADSLKRDNLKPIYGKRLRKSIMKTVMINLAKLRYAYNKRLREKPALFGKITVKYSIAQTGNVVSSSIVSSTIDDSELEEVIKNKIKNWKFDTLNVAIDTTEVVYPFVFTQGQTEEEVKKLDFEKEKRGDRSTDDLLNGWSICNNQVKSVFDQYSTRSGKQFGNFNVLISITTSGFVDNIVLKNTTIEFKETEIELLEKIREITFPNCFSCTGNTEVDFSFGYFNKK
jgi:hypothetical protein